MTRASWGLFLLILLAGLAGALLLTVGQSRPTHERVPLPPKPIAAEKNSLRIVLTPLQRSEAAAKSAPLGQIRSLLKVSAPLKYGQFVWDEKAVPAGPAWIRADPSTQTISIFRGGHEIGVAVFLYGADVMPTPGGAFTILAKSEKHQSRQYNAPMPYSLWLTKDGVAIHGSNVRWGAATHGCIGVPIEFAKRLFKATKVGDRVDVAV